MATGKNFGTGHWGRPIVFTKITGVGDPIPDYQWFDALYDFSTPPEKIIDLVLKHFTSSRFYGDAYHAWFPNFGSGALTAMVGGKKLQLIGPIDQVAKALKVVRNLNAVCVFAYGELQDMAIAEKMEAEYCR